ncbi:MAG TPA: DNA-processing protein DprA [Marinospirillum sp.]|uniref:DNA-processing protein DprA n=1 Tax=Marinospirillum sp. TaxID=2183934 RepID=UPI002B460450|nr:DNA-processing protein DprA [Marinospirillum sp.]HKM16018.1 DNA-processing protein DprA [Marinospirillum sp.]
MPLDKTVEQLTQALALWLIPGSNQRRVVKSYLATTGLPDASLATAESLLDLMARNTVFSDKTRDLARLALHDPWQLPFADRIEAHLIWAEQANHHLIFLADLPSLLQQLADPPLLLCVAGQPAQIEAPSLAVVGSRKLSSEGEHHAANWSYHLAWQGLNIVSGLARGVDGYAHQGALRAVAEGAFGTTCAVLAHGLDRIYPPEHRAMAANISQTGALISEYPLGTPPIARYFPARNRLVTGMSLGILVVEAALQSGSLVSARHAMEQGREVMAIPGSIRYKQSEGCHQLIRQGAALVTCPEDVLSELSVPLNNFLAVAAPSISANTSNLSANTSKPLKRTLKVVDVPEHLHSLYALLNDLPQPTDALLATLKLTAEQGSVLLLELELEGLAVQKTGGWCKSA